MEPIDFILTRRSIRRYTNQPVLDETIRLLLEAAMSAPSAKNEQPWHFIVIKDRKILDKIPEFHPYSEMLKYASVAILVCGDTSMEKYKGSWVLDCAAATENILLASHAMDLGSVWLGFYPHMDRVKCICDLLELPSNVIPLSLIPVGYPDEFPPERKRFNFSRIHYDKW